MRFLRRWSIKTKLILLSVVAVGAALAVACVGILLHEMRSMRALKMAALRAQTEMLAFNSTGVLSFKDVPAASRLLASLQSEPTVEFGVLYDEDGRVLASYPADLPSAPSLPTDMLDACRYTDEGFVEAVLRVVDQGDHVGSLYLRANTADLRARLSQNLGFTASMLFIAMAGSMLLVAWLQRSISGPIVRLAGAASAIGALGDYSIRVERKSEDELGVLCDEFNRMLDRVEDSDKALKQAHDELEERVVERTAELREEISRREKVQGELVRAKEAAEAANVAKSHFLANMSHEIRTPLNAILGFADLLLKGGERIDQDDRKDYLHTIHTSGKHLLTLINDILDLSKIEADRLQVEEVRCSPHEIVSEVVSVLRVKALEKKLSFDYRWNGGVPESISTDPARFRQLLMNLVGNAVKFTRSGGVQIVAELARDEAAPQLVIHVIDSGVGIPQDKFEAIFDPFVQADTSVTRQFGGTGLGLTISRRIAQALGGGIHLSSEVGKGSDFTVTLATGPLDGVAMLDAPPADGVQSSRQRQQEPLPSLTGSKILLVEDGDANRKLIGLVLKRAGAEVATAENGKLGADRALEERFDAILMDMQMPVMDGYTAATLLRQHGLTIPIVALTAHAMKGDESKCRAAGCSGYVTKPIDGDLLVRTVARILAVETPMTAPGCDAPQDQAAESPTPAPTPTRPAGPAIFSDLPTDDPDFREIVEEFTPRLEEQLAAMQVALEASDLAELARLAHWLKGAGGTVGFPVFTQPAKRLELLAKDRQCDEIEATLAELLDLSKRISIGPAEPASAIHA